MRENFKTIDSLESQLILRAIYNLTLISTKQACRDEICGLIFFNPKIYHALRAELCATEDSTYILLQHNSLFIVTGDINIIILTNFFAFLRPRIHMQN